MALLTEFDWEARNVIPGIGTTWRYYSFMASRDMPTFMSGVTLQYSSPESVPATPPQRAKRETLDIDFTINGLENLTLANWSPFIRNENAFNVQHAIRTPFTALRARSSIVGGYVLLLNNGRLREVTSAGVII